MSTVDEPPVELEPSPEHVRARRRALLDEISGAPRRRARRRLVLALAAAAAAAAAGAGVAAYLAMREPARHLQSVSCYGSASLDARSVVFAPAAGEADVSDPVAACGVLWQSGTFGSPAKVPELSACVFSGDEIAVFPGPASVCARLGGARLAPAYRARALQLHRLERALLAPYRRTGCLSLRESVADARRVLAQHGFTWKVAVDRSLPLPRPACASLYIDEPGRRVVIVPVPPSS
jgi:hypothetical protein